MSASLAGLSPLPRPRRKDPVAVPRVPSGASIRTGAADGWRVEERADGEAVVRFWHRASSASAVALSVSGWARPVPVDACDLAPVDDGWWTAAFRVPDDWQARYEMLEHHGAGRPSWHADGLHRRPGDASDPRPPGRPGAVRLAEGREWALAGERSGDTERTVALEPERPDDPSVRLWRSGAGADAVPLVVFLDGEAHLDRLGTPAVIRAAQEAGVVPDLAAAFVDAGPRRPAVLGVPHGQAEWIARRLIPRLHDEGVLGPVAHRETVVTGSSFGGLSALFALAHSPAAIGAIVAQSTSFWRFDPERLEAALADAVEGSSARVRLHAGLYEGDGPARSAELAERLRVRGVDASARVVTGGHDWTWWVPEAIEEIGSLLRP